MVSTKGLYSLVASAGTSIVITLAFYLLAVQKGGYTGVDIYAGMLYVFILAMIVSASIWPGAIDKLMKR